MRYPSPPPRLESFALSLSFHSSIPSIVQPKPIKAIKPVAVVKVAAISK